MKANPSRPLHRNVGIFQLIPYVLRFPASAWVSLLHRISGALLFLVLPLCVWVFDASLSSEHSFAKLVGIFRDGLGIVPGWMLKLLVLVVLWSFLHHLIAGLRFLVLDVHHASVEKVRAQYSAKWVLVLSVGLTLSLGAKIFGFY